MYVQTDTSGLYQVGAPFVAPAVKRAPIAPAQNGDRAQEDRRQNQQRQDGAAANGSVFRTLLSDATSANLTKALGKTPEIAATESTQFVRAEKRPPVEPASLSNEDVTSAYSFLGGQSRSAEASATESSATDEQTQRFATASAAYTKQTVDESHVFATRGEVLELQA